MNARAIGDFTAAIFNASAPPGHQKLRRTGQPVRRNSYQAGEREQQVWRPIADGTRRGARRWIGAVMRAAEAYDRKHKQPGKRNGALGHIALEVLRELFRIVDYRNGCLEPSIETLQMKTRRSRAAVVAALARLKRHGFLQWIRRTQKTDNEGGFGPQVKQISNAYGFDVKRLPKDVAQQVRSMVGAAPPPDDDTARRAQDMIDTEAMFVSLPLCEQGSARASDPALGAALDRLGRLVENASSLNGQNPGTEG